MWGEELPLFRKTFKLLKYLGYYKTRFGPTAQLKGRKCCNTLWILNISPCKTENTFPRAKKKKNKSDANKETGTNWGHLRHRRPENQVKHAKQLFLRYLCGNIKSQFQLMTIETKHNRKESKTEREREMGEHRHLPWGGVERPPTGIKNAKNQQGKQNAELNETRFFFFFFDLFRQRHEK